MAKIKPWYKVVTPREDLREGKPLDAAEFAVHLDQVREGRAKEDYQDPQRFFERTYLTKNLLATSGEAIRRLAGEQTEASAVFNMTTQFGGGKTHALTLLYHLAENGEKAKSWQGVPQILQKAGIKTVPQARTAVFVGTEFDSIDGRGGDDGSPRRVTPWGEIAYQLSGEEGFAVVEEHEKQRTAPGGEVIRKFLPKDKPSLILVDELLNYISRNRKSGLSTQLYNFIHNLSEEARGRNGVVLVVSIPASELEMSADDQSDYERFKKMLDRLGKPVIMSAEGETSEIIRRRLFEWDPKLVSRDGRVMLSREAVTACGEYADWVSDHRHQLPELFSIDRAREVFQSAYPFHPMVLSVFERKWQELPRFQQTRAILRLLALWVSHAYREGFKGARRDPLIGVGSAPLEDSMFRTAVFEQLGDQRLEGAVTTDIAGKTDSHAVRLDEEAQETLRKARIHQQVATTMFFESNGGQTKQEATLSEIRLAVAGPEIDLGNVETALDALTETCYYLNAEGNRYRFSLKENLNKRYADRRASVKQAEIDKRVQEEVQKLFKREQGVERVFFPTASAQILDRPSVTMVIMDPSESVQDDPKIQEKIETMTREHGKSARTYKSALLWIVPDSSGPLKEEARKLLAWKSISEEGLKLDEKQAKQLDANVKKAQRDISESVWRAYRHVLLLDQDNSIKRTDVGPVTSSAAESLPKFILTKLRSTGEIEREVSPRFLVRKWPPAFKKWSTKSVRDAFYASPQFPRLLDQQSIRATIARGVQEGHFAYVSDSPSGSHQHILFEVELRPENVEISDDVFILKEVESRKPELERIVISPSPAPLKPGVKQAFKADGFDQLGHDVTIEEIHWEASGGEIGSDGVFTAGRDEGNFLVTAEAEGKKATAEVIISKGTVLPPVLPKRLRWNGELPPGKWTNLYMQVLTKLVSRGKVKLSLGIEASPKTPISEHEIEEIKAAFRGLGLSDKVREIVEKENYVDQLRSASVEELVERGESENLELKSTLRWSIKAKRMDKEMTHAVMKTIAAFLNTDGGILLIGVDDQGVACELLKLDQFENEDKEMLHLNNRVTNHIGTKYMASYVKIAFQDFKGSRVLRVDCHPSSTPAYVKDGEKQLFYVRSGPATRQLPTSEIYSYIKDRFFSSSP